MDKRWIVPLSFLFLAAAAQAAPGAPKGVSGHEIDVVEKSVKINGKDTKARMFALRGGTGQLPGPAIRAREGQTLKATFCNKMGEPTSIHWHGARLPNNQDGVPGVTTPDIKPGECLTYQFPVVQSGTYWYHAHSNGQEQQGLYGSLIFDPREEDDLRADYEIPVILSDFTHEEPKQVLRNLKRADDYYALCKGTTQSWDKVLANGGDAVGNRLKGNMDRMGPMDKTDVCYSGPGDAFLVNGKPESVRIDNPKNPVRQHKSVRLRIVNAGASSTFDVRSGCGGDMTIIAKDGMPVESRDVSSLQMAPAETYDIKIYKHEEKSCGIRATSIDGTGAVVGVIGGEPDPVLPPPMEKPNPFLQGHDHHGGSHGAMASDGAGHDAHAGHDMGGHHHDSGHHEGMDHGSMNHAAPALDLSYSGLRAKDKTPLDPTRPWRNITLKLTGQMNGYVWSFDNKVFSDAKPIQIRQGDNVRLTLVNDSMMDHPIHIHGFFGRLRNDGKDSAVSGPLMNVIIVPVGKTVVTEFNADVSGDWMLHCHIAYHMESGMARILRVEPEGGAGYDPFTNIHNIHSADSKNPVVPGHAGHDLDKAFLFSGQAGAYGGMSNGNPAGMVDGEFRYGNYQDKFQLELKAGPERQRGELTYERRLTPYFGLFTGVEWERERGHGERAFENSVNGLFGFRYTLPLMIETEAAVLTDGGVKLKIGTGDIHLTERIYLNLGAKIEKRPGEGVRIFENPEIGYRFSPDAACGIRRDTYAGMDIGVGCRFGF